MGGGRGFRRVVTGTTRKLQDWVKVLKANNSAPERRKEKNSTSRGEEGAGAGYVLCRRKGNDSYAPEGDRGEGVKTTFLSHRKHTKEERTPRHKRKGGQIIRVFPNGERGEPKIE